MLTKKLSISNNEDEIYKIIYDFKKLILFINLITLY